MSQIETREVMAYAKARGMTFSMTLKMAVQAFMKANPVPIVSPSFADSVALSVNRNFAATPLAPIPVTLYARQAPVDESDSNFTD
jgi:hypothetical protein